MKKAAFVVVLACFAALMIAGCGDSAKKSCTTSQDCNPGEVCGVDLLCGEVVCNGKGDCSTGEICVAGDLVGKDANWKFCSWPLCDNVTKLCTANQTCQDGICVDNTIEPDTIGDTNEPDATRDTNETDTAADVVEDLPDITVIKDCATCTISSDCGTGYTCQPVGSEKRCLRDCNNDGSCLPGYTCYTSGTTKSCLPVSYNCVACTFETPCDEGKCCDFNTGACKTCEPECGSCTYDYDCENGLRCYKTTGSAAGVCVPECVDGACTDSANYTCNDNGKGVEMCVPKTATGCKGCEDPTPWPLDDGSCVECRTSDDCDENEACASDDHTCVTDKCSTGTILCDDGECHQCCVDDDCLQYEDSTGICLAESKTCEGHQSCGGLCTSEFPICQVVSGVEQCVQCAVDADCALIKSGCTCVGDPMYSCVDETGALCQADNTCLAKCEDESDCPPTSTGAAMGCASVSGSTTGLCYDPAGTCDAGVSACCAPGQSCYDLMVLIMGVMGGGMMGLPEGMTSGSGYCACETADDCINGKDCTDLSMICTLGSLLGSFASMIELICPGGTLSTSMPSHLCVSLTDLLGGII